MEALLGRLYDISSKVDLTDIQQKHRVFQLIKRGFAEAASFNDEAKELIQDAFGTSAPPTPQKFRGHFQSSMQMDAFPAPVKLDFDESIELFESPGVIPATRTPLPTRSQVPTDKTPHRPMHRIPPATAPRNQKADLQKAEQRRLKNLTEKAERVRREREDREARVRLRRLQLESEKKSAARGRNVFKNTDYMVYGDATPVRHFKKAWDHKAPAPRPITVPSERQSITPVIYQSPPEPSIVSPELENKLFSTPNTVARDVPVLSRNTPSTDIPDEFCIVPEDELEKVEEHQVAEQETFYLGHSDSTAMPSALAEPPIQDSILFLQSEIPFDVSAQEPVPIDNEANFAPTLVKVDLDENCNVSDSDGDHKTDILTMPSDGIHLRPSTPDIVPKATDTVDKSPAQPWISSSPRQQCRQDSLFEQLQFTVQSPEVCRDVHSASDTIFDDEAILAVNVADNLDDGGEKEDENVDTNGVKCLKTEASSSFETVAFVVPEDPVIKAVMTSPIKDVDVTQDSTVSVPSPTTVSVDLPPTVIARQTEYKDTKARISFYDDDDDFVENVPPVKTKQPSNDVAETKPPVTAKDPKPKATKKKPRDPLMPKRPTNAYLYWAKVHRADYAKPGMTGNEVTRAAAQGWKELVDKQVWQAMADADKKRYEEEMAQYKPVV